MPNLQDAYNYCIDACNWPYLGYSQAQNRTIDITSTSITYCDCASLMSKCMTVGGYFTSNPWFWTYNQPEMMINAGWVEQDLYGEWKPGDILWYRYGGISGHGHTEMVYTGGNARGVLMGAHGAVNRAFPDQVSIRSGESTAAGSDWMKLFRAPDGEVVPYDPGTQPVNPGDGGVPTPARLRAMIINDLQRRLVIPGRH